MAAKNEAKVRFSADTKEFDNGIKSANRELSGLRAELKLNEAQMKANGVSVEGLQAKQKNLTAQMEAAQDKTKALSDKLAVAVEIFGENSDEAAKLRNQLANAQTAEVNLQRALNNCNAELVRQEEAANHVATASEELTGEISDQKSELDKLKRAYVDAVLEFGEGSDEAQALAGEIEDLSSELKTNRDRMNDAERAADALDNSLDDVEDGANNAGDGFTVFKGALADLVSEGIQSAISAVGDLISYFGELPEATRELRQDFATLDTAFTNVGLSTEVAEQTWKDLYAVFGEDDRAVEAANNIARMADSQEDLNDWVTITTGIWGTYQDSLPVEGLAEAAAETAKTGTVTGGLADALNWSSEAATMFADYMSDEVVTAEDAFNVALSECTTEQERQTLITDTLTKLYGGAADTYRETAGAQMDAKEATAEQTLAEADLADAIEPVTTKWTEMKTALLVGVLPAIEAISGAMLGVMTWLQEHPVALQVLAGVLGVVAAAIATLTIVTTAQTIAQWAMNSAILANPLTWVIVGIVAAIAAVVAIIIIVINYWDQIVAAVTTAVEAVKTALGAAVTWINESVIQPIAEFFSGLWTGISEAFTAAWEWIKSTPIFQFYSDLFTSIWNTVSSVISVIVELFRGGWEIIKAVWGVVSGWFNTTIVQPISGFFSGLWSGVTNAAKNAWNSLKNGASQAWAGIKSIFSPVAEFFGNIFSNAWAKVKAVFSTGGKIFDGIKDGIVSAFKTVVNAIIRGINRVVSIPFNAINSVLSRIRNTSFLGISPFSSLGTISVPQIPLLAEGGILTRATLNIAGEAGPEAIIPIDKLQDYISSAIDRTMQVVNINALVAAVEDLANRPIQMNVNGRQFAVATAADTDSVNGNRLALSKRGLAL